MSVVVHGWRRYGLGHCKSVNGTVLIGGHGMHCHGAMSKLAECAGYERWAMWAAEKTPEHLKGGHPEIAPPHIDCTCGFYYRIRILDEATRQGGIWAHVTALGKVVIHVDEEKPDLTGGRMAAFVIDYFLPGVGSLLSHQSGVSYNDEVCKSTLRRWADEWKVPIYEKDDLRGCLNCIEANNWLPEKEVRLARQKGLGLQL